MTSLKDDGYVWLRNAVAEPDILNIENLLSKAMMPGQRIKLDTQILSVLNNEGSIGQRIAPYLENPKATRLVSFDKSNTMNWAVPWHQDRVIAVNEKADLDGFKSWTRKSEVWHCEPPTDILENMLFVRLHLDDSTFENGPMEIIPRSHKLGIIPAVDADAISNKMASHICTAKRGDILIMNMLILHRSKPSKNPSPRRTLRIDYANFDLPFPLEWSS
ncbi:phytanoyl-CoA dioxygenase family protein [Amylibacter sp. SFDW26]|uniref:phytanoyl-CoA dioxygenase family protein n=1 Tax=Amylibacter sp. SFDW26 TaxID=2652722 RepID=UPI001262481D|nr:phytanoyl-CoA dioxygenase family protein [Amylibacter sp. SFDW26]KAB7615354.1 phytanoyl-CoA dioxygenase family protein [Amylibacter sp. SFDW26]